MGGEGGEFDGSEKKGGGGQGAGEVGGKDEEVGGGGEEGQQKVMLDSRLHPLMPALSGTFGSRLGRDRWRTPGLSGVPAAHGPVPSPRRARRTDQSAHCGRLRPQVRRGPGDSF